MFGVLVCFVVFWMLGLGLFGVVFYCMVEYLLCNWCVCFDGMFSLVLCYVVVWVWDWVDYLLVWVMVLGFVIVGNFEEVVVSWCSDVDSFVLGSDGVVLVVILGVFNVWFILLVESVILFDDFESGMCFEL